MARLSVVITGGTGYIGGRLIPMLVSVAEPAPIMRAYVDVRRRVEEEIVFSGSFACFHRRVTARRGSVSSR